MIVQKDIYEEAKAQASWNTIMADLQALSSATGITPDDFKPITIYLVKETPTGVERYENRLYCTMADIESGAYRTALISAALGTEEYWKSYGLEGYLRGDKADEAMLKAAYEQADNLDGLSLFISYFNEAFASEEEIHLAEQTAMAVARYVLENHGAKALLTEDCIAYKQEWLKSLGVDRVYDDPLYHELEDYRFSSTTQYPLVATNSHEHVFYILPLQDMQTAGEVRRFLYDAAAGPRAILEFVKEQAPEYHESLKNLYEGKMSIYCNTQRGGHAEPTTRTIWIPFIHSYPHELGHILIPPQSLKTRYEEFWRYEGLCNYLNEIIAPTYAMMKSYYWDLLVLYSKTGAAEGEGKTQNPENRKFWARVTEIYLNNAEMPSSVEELDMSLILQAKAIAPLRYPEELKDSMWCWPRYKTSSVNKNTPGNEITDDQASSLTMYLIDQYTLRPFLDYCTEKASFDEAFGVSYEEAKEAWLEELNKLK